MGRFILYTGQKPILCVLNSEWNQGYTKAHIRDGSHIPHTEYVIGSAQIHL